jgi:hypothetical protein
MHELFEILEVIPHWQERFATLRDAAEYANALPEYYEYMHSNEGALRRLQIDNVPDTVAANRAARLMRERMMNRASRSNRYVQDELDAPHEDSE